MHPYDPKKFSFRGIKGFSARQLQEHYQLYLGYVNKWHEIQTTLVQTPDFQNPNGTYSLLRCLQLGQSFALNSIKLHELYFANLGQVGMQESHRSQELSQLIRRDCAGYQVFTRRFLEVAMAVRGWVVLAIDPIDQKLHIYGSDAHDVGSIWNAWPLLVLDVYEHAYMIDFGINRRKYLEVFMNNVNWEVVNERLSTYYQLPPAYRGL